MYEIEGVASILEIDFMESDSEINSMSRMKSLELRAVPRQVL